MNAAELIFYLISAYILVTGVLAVTTRKVFRASIWLLFSLVGIAALYFWMDLQFVAAVQIIVYVGGIVVLIIFSIFLTQKAGNEMPAPMPGRTIYAGLASLLGLGLVCNLLLHTPFAEGSGLAFNPGVEQLGFLLLSTGDGGFVLPFEVVSILLLAAMIGCIVIAMKSGKEQGV